MHTSIVSAVLDTFTLVCGVLQNLRRMGGINDATEITLMDVSCVPAFCTAVHAMLECSVEITERVASMYTLIHPSGVRSERELPPFF